MSKFLKKTSNNKSPGCSGFSGDFYKFFWRDLKHFVVRSVNYSFDIGSLSIQQRLTSLELTPVSRVLTLVTLTMSLTFMPMT